MTRTRMAIGTLCAIGVGTAIAAKRRSSDKGLSLGSISKKFHIGNGH